MVASDLSPSQRVDLEAGIATVPALLPFDARGKQRIRDIEQYENSYAFTYGIEYDGPVGISSPQSELLDHWYAWLWERGDPNNRCEQPSVEAQTLAEACGRLANALGALAMRNEWPHNDQAAASSSLKTQSASGAEK